MPFKGTRPICTCGHANCKHCPDFDEHNVVRDYSLCRVKSCDCIKYNEVEGFKPRERFL